MINKIKNKIITGNRRVETALNANCSEFEVNHWILDEFILKKIIPVSGIHPFPLCELSLLVSTVAGLKPTQIFEWGTNIGKSARIFYEVCKYFNVDSEIHTIDLPDDVFHCEHPKQKRGVLVKNKRNVFMHQGDGVTVSLDIYKKNTTERPLFFLDGDHSFESVSRELNLILENVKNPVILVHDTFYQSSESGYNIGPYLAIKKMMQDNLMRFKLVSTANGLPGLTLLYQ